METRICGYCRGSGKSHLSDYAGHEKDVCHTCKGEPNMPEPDYTQILKDITGRKGLRSQRPKASRSYYVWRMARFNGGVDVTMPVMAQIDNEGDPWLKELDTMSDVVAKKFFGTDMAAAHRWGNLLFGEMKTPEGLPSTAYSGGPVVIGSKPESEMMEIA